MLINEYPKMQKAGKAAKKNVTLMNEARKVVEKLFRGETIIAQMNREYLLYMYYITVAPEVVGNIERALWEGIAE